MSMWIWILLWAISLIVLASIITVGIYRDIKKYSSAISFKEGLDLTELPITTFSCGDKKLHFLLDTGSNISYINKGTLSDIEYTTINKSSAVVGLEGNPTSISHCIINIGYKDNIFKEEFGVVDLSNTFKAISDSNGIELHGILGSKFFEKYKYILDFKDLTAYR